ncbi:protein kinase [Fervidicella metallireducens AeB]|uniref:Protein kinase n=1 Tax=Fervidicella metallireducens AeB TaxID=1403537 RepID=A0A017RQZ1_9CLOT|nr:HipA domain-containing protein [Fervidicella metallireducens]EYE87163.1 protein kinase [Fervidicella metallireducens AeB]
MIKDFSNWIEYEGASEGSGRSEKIWLVNPENGEVGLFKFTKSSNTTEHVSEKIASELAILIGIECMKVDLGIFNSRIGSLSYKINKDDEILIEGIQLINKYFPNYDENSLYDNVKDEYYSLDMIMKSLKDYNLQYEFLKIPIFDYLIGNTDRHHSNWAIIQKDKNVKLSPLYDNGSSLCCYINEDKIDGYLGNDKMKFESILINKSTSRIRIDKKTRKEPKHKEVLEFIKNNYYNEVIDFIQTINTNVNEKNIDILLENYVGIISDKRIKLIKKYLVEKVRIMVEIFELRGKGD